MARKVKLALGQVPAGQPAGPPEAVRAHHKANMEPLIARAGAERADALCFCETALTTGIKAPPDDRSAWQDVTDGPDFQWASRQAARHGLNLIMPAAGLCRGALRNVALVLDRRGGLAGVYEKVHLNASERRAGRAGGDSWPVFELDFGRVGVMICHDLHFPEAPRCLALNGAEIVFWPTHYGAIWGDDYLMALLRATAVLNGVYLAAVSLAPPPGEPWTASMHLARSGVIGPRGEWRFSAGFEPGLAVGEVDLDEPLVRPWFSTGDRRDDYRAMYRADRRPETYGRLLER